MAFNGSGTFNLAAGNPVTTGTTISSTWANSTLSDVATGLTNCITRDGQSTPLANIPMGNYKLTGLGQAAATGDALAWGKNASVVDLAASGTVSGTGFSTYLASPPAIGSTAASTGAFTTLSASSTVSGTGFSTYLASPPAIGGTTPAAITGTTLTGAVTGSIGATTPNTGAFTTLSASSTVSGTGFSNYLASPPAIGSTTAAAITGTVITATGSVNTPNTFGFKNRIINGAMMIDQRNAGASVTVNVANPTYGVDRFFGWGQAAAGVFTIQQSTTAPTGFKNSTKITVTTADGSLGAIKVYAFGQAIEGFNTADLGFGAAGASTVTISFWVQSSITGTYSATLFNNAYSRGYTASFTINSANTWEQKTLTIVGDTSGTWTTDNTTGIRLWISLGTGSTYTGTASSWNAGTTYAATGQVNLISTLNATMYITGVQLEKGSTATSFDYRPYGTELALCQRYYQTNFNGIGVRSYVGSGAGLWTTAFYKQTMRAAPTVSVVGTWTVGNCGQPVPSGSVTGVDSVMLAVTATNSTDTYFYASNSTMGVTMSAEL